MKKPGIHLLTLLFLLLAFETNAQTDIRVDAVYTYGKIPSPLAVYQLETRAKLTNTGANTASNVAVYLNVSGANVYKDTVYVTLVAGSSQTISFETFSPWNHGTNNYSVTVPNDNNNANNSAVYTQVVTSDVISYADASPPGSSLGFNGILLSSFRLPARAIVKKIRAFISTDINNINNVVTAVVTDGYSIKGSSLAHTILPAELGTYVSFDIVNPPDMEYSFYAGLSIGTPVANDYFPLGLQTEGLPTRSGAFYFSNYDGTGITEYPDAGRYMIEVETGISNINTEFPPPSSPTRSIAKWDFTGINSPVSMNATYTDTILSAVPVLSRGPGAPASTGNNGFYSAAFANNGFSVSNTDYFHCSVTPKTGDTLDLDYLYLGLANNTTLSSNIRVAYSTDGINYAFIENLSYYQFPGNSAYNFTLKDLPAFQNILGGNTIRFRFYFTKEDPSGNCGFTVFNTFYTGLEFVGKTSISNRIYTNALVPTGAPYVLPDCNTPLSGSIGFTSTGNYGTGNQYIVQLGRIFQPNQNVFFFRSVVNVGSINSTANAGTINFSIPAGSTTDYYALRIVSTNPPRTGSYSLGFPINGPYCKTDSTDQFRSKATGNWTNLNIWESSNNGIQWIPATLLPNEYANKVTISNNDTVQITTDILTQHTLIKGTLQLLNGNGNNGTFAVLDLFPGPFFSPGLIIDTTGVFQVISSVATLNNCIFIENRMRVAGKILIGDGLTPIAGGFEGFATADGWVIWFDGSVFEWNSPAGIAPKTDTTYFVNYDSDNQPYVKSPTFRLTSIPPGNFGGTNNTVINGLLEVNTPVTWEGSGTKTFKDGILGTSTVSQAPGCGEFKTTSAFSVIPPSDTSVATFRGVINGKVNINLNNAGYTLIQGATIPDTADVHIAGPTRSTNKIEVLTGGRLTLDAGSVLDIQDADLVNNGTLNGPGIVQFSGAIRSKLTSPGIITAPILMISKELFLGSHSNTASINLTDHSHLMLDSFNLSMKSSTLLADSVNFIVTNDTGRLIRTVGTSATAFPIGIDTASYTPVTVTNTGLPDDLKVRVGQGVRTYTNFVNGYVDRTWFIDSTTGGSRSSLKIQWNEADEQTFFDRSGCYIGQNYECQPPPNCNDSYFDVVARTPAQGTNPYSQTRDNITGPTAFVVKSIADTSYFTGNGNWNDPNNWTIGIVPSNIIEDGKVIIINHLEPGECFINNNIIVKPKGRLIILPNKKFRVLGP